MGLDRLIKWTAKRSGAGMTIEGTDTFGRPRKIFVVSIRGGAVGRPSIATAPDGTECELA